MKVEHAFLIAAAFAAALAAPCLADAKKAPDKAPKKVQQAAPKKDAEPKRDAEPRKGDAPKKAQEAPLPPKPDETAIAKAIKAKKPVYSKLAEAKEAAWNCQQPLIVALLVAGDPKSQQLEAKALRHRAFAKDFVPANCVLLVWRLKPGKPEMPQAQGRRRGPPPRPTTIETRPLKPHETDFLSKFAVSESSKANAKRRGNPEPKFSEMQAYPTVLCVDPSCRKIYFRDPKYDASLGSPNASFGTWMSQTVNLFRSTKREPVLTPSLQKIVDNPTEPRKWK